MKIRELSNFEKLKMEEYCKLENLDLRTDYHIYKENITDLDGIEECIYIKKLTIPISKQVNISKLKQLNNLETLNITPAVELILADLKDLKALKTLSLHLYFKPDLHNLPIFEKLETLNLQQVCVNNLNFLVQYEHLKNLKLIQCFNLNLENFPILEKLENLTIWQKNFIINSQLLAKLPNLKTLDITFSDDYNLKELKKYNPNLKIIYR